MNTRRARRWSGSMEPAMTLDQVAAELGVSRERVRQIENKALKKLRAALDERGITADDVHYGETQATDTAA